MQVCRQRKNLRITNAASTKNNPSNHRSPLLPSLSFIVRPEKQLPRGHRGVISSHRSPESDVSRRLPRFRYRGCFEAVNKFPHFGASGGRPLGRSQQAIGRPSAQVPIVALLSLMLRSGYQSYRDQSPGTRTPARLSQQVASGNEKKTVDPGLRQTSGECSVLPGANRENPASWHGGAERNSKRRRHYGCKTDA